tara:strand:- start:1461 stop:1619 length:159 start_codon:yes stop_codon:yes gene_type:complete
MTEEEQAQQELRAYKDLKALRGLRDTQVWLSYVIVSVTLGLMALAAATALLV